MNVRTKQHPCCFLIAISLLTCLGSCQGVNYNQSICADIVINDLHYYINDAQNNLNIQLNNANTITTYNLCKQVEIYCKYQNSIITASMVIINPTLQTCTALQQTQVTYADGINFNSGIQVIYKTASNIIPQVNYTLTYPCNTQTKQYCPSVESGVVSQYFANNVIVYTIVIQIIGIILMVFGIYIYRVTIVLLGTGTFLMFLVLLQSYTIFVRGIPNAILKDVIIMSIAASFFVGYILGYFPKAGIFCMGMWIGIIISLTLNNICLYFINSNPSNLALYIIMPILSIAFGVISIFIKRTFIIFASSLIGSYFCLRALSWSLGTFPNQFVISKQYHFGISQAVPWQFYLYVIALLILTASSSALQHWLFKKKMKQNHEEANFQKHFNDLQNSMVKEREHVIEIKGVWQDDDSKPRVLDRNNRSSGSNYEAESILVQEDRKVEFKEDQEGSLPGYDDSDEVQSSSDSQDEKTKQLRKKLLGRVNVKK